MDLREGVLFALGTFVSLFGSFVSGVALPATLSDAGGLIELALLPSLAATVVVFAVYMVTRSRRVAFGGVALPLCVAAFAVGTIYGRLIASM